jgi:L,D-transpeptidase catalytic domain
LPLTVTGGLKNPQGARAIYLGNTIYRIHGTNNDRSVGRANSSGCFRLTNEHVVHLASIAKVGAKVKVLQTYAGGVSETAPLSSLFSFWGTDPAKPAARSKAKKATPAVAKTLPAKAKAAPSAEATKAAQ